MKRLTVILDAAHGKNVAGKQSPDGLHKEYIWSRHMIGLLKPLLEKEGFSYHETVPSEMEIGLSQRVKRANEFPGSHKLLISLHNNAAGDGSKWHKATGVEVYTCKGNTNSDWWSAIIYNEMKNDFPELVFRGQKEENFTVLMGHNYAAMLIEWLFQDNHKDLAFIESEVYNKALAETIVAGLKKIEALLN